MSVEIEPTTLDRIQSDRDDYRQEMNCQIIHDSVHSRPGWTREYRLRVNGNDVGYGSVAIAGPWNEVPTLYEFFVARSYRTMIFKLFDAIVDASGVTRVETQTNAPLLSTMLHSRCKDVDCEAVLFRDDRVTHLSVDGMVFRATTPDDEAGLRESELALNAEWVVVNDERIHDRLEAYPTRIVAAGRLLHHYNRPYHDIWMAVAEPFRKQGVGAFIVQELKRVCYESGSVPAARCNTSNTASRQTLQNAGFVPCGNLITGTLLR